MKKLLTPFTDLVSFYLQFGMDCCKWKVWHGSGFGINTNYFGSSRSSPEIRSPS